MQRRNMQSGDKNNWRKMLEGFRGGYYPFRQPLGVVIRFQGRTMYVKSPL